MFQFTICEFDVVLFFLKDFKNADFFQIFRILYEMFYMIFYIQLVLNLEILKYLL